MPDETTRNAAESPDGHEVTVDGKRYVSEHQFLRALVAFYDADSVKCAHLCDDVLDRSGALLGRVRSIAWT